MSQLSPTPLDRIKQMQWRRTRTGSYVANLGDDECILVNVGQRGRYTHYRAVINGEGDAVGRWGFALKIVQLRLLELAKKREAVMALSRDLGYAGQVLPPLYDHQREALEKCQSIEEQTVYTPSEWWLEPLPEEKVAQAQDAYHAELHGEAEGTDEDSDRIFAEEG